VRALRGAYLDALSAACRRHAGGPTPGDGAPPAELYRVEAALRQRGRDVRQPCTAGRATGTMPQAAGDSRGQGDGGSESPPCRGAAALG